MVASPTLSGDVHPIFLAHDCAASSCHSGSRQREGLDLSTPATSFNTLVNVPSSTCTGRTRVTPGSVSGSYLVNKLTGSGMCGGRVMPGGGRPPLGEDEIDVIRAWIAGGAVKD